MKRFFGLTLALALGIGIGLGASVSAQTVFRNYTTLNGTEIITDAANPTGASFTTLVLGKQILHVTATTVGALPSCSSGLKGTLYLVTDATTPSYLGTITNGGSAVIPVVCDGTNWASH